MIVSTFGFDKVPDTQIDKAKTQNDHRFFGASFLCLRLLLEGKESQSISVDPRYLGNRDNDNMLEIGETTYLQCVGKRIRNPLVYAAIGS